MKLTDSAANMFREAGIAGASRSAVGKVLGEVEDGGLGSRRRVRDA